MSTQSPVQFGNPLAEAGPAEFTASMAAALPPGDGWTGSVMADLMAGLGQSFADLHGRAYQLSDVETVPATTDELLPFWNADYGLPDCCTPLGATLQQQRYALLAKIAQVGGQSANYYVAVAAALGFVITVSEGAVGSFTWTVNAAASSTLLLFRAGVSVAGDRLEYPAANAQLECVLNQIKPAHTILDFVYGALPEFGEAL